MHVVEPGRAAEDGAAAAFAGDVAGEGGGKGVVRRGEAGVVLGDLADLDPRPGGGQGADGGGEEGA